MVHRSTSIVITGASSGIGGALARAYAGPGVRLLLIARDADRTEASARACRAKGAEVESALIDVRDGAALDTAIGAFDRRTPVDLVIANAGLESSLGPGRAAEPLSSSLEQLRINLEGAVATVTPLLQPMRGRGRGHIVLLSSLAALEPLPDQPAYCAAKAGVAAWGEALRVWLKPSGVAVSVVYPGFVDTGMSADYRGWRPFQISAEAAAARIRGGIARRQPVIAFPWQLVWLIRLGRLSPRFAKDFVLDAGFRFEIKPTARGVEEP